VIQGPKGETQMYFTEPRTSRSTSRANTFGAAAVTALDAKSNQECRAEERRISPVVEPPASALVTVERRHGGPRLLHRDTYAAYQRLKAAAEADGIPANVLTIVSGYRSVASQRALWETALLKYGSPQAARHWVAPPGGSPHHTGRAIDFYLGGRNISENVGQLRRTAAYHWLVCNAVRFGFYPYAAEPWHWEYNPPAAPAGTAEPAVAGCHGFTGPFDGTIPGA
jgi:LAS superfamily LD-carboxypeptidase LdcB